MNYYTRLSSIAGAAVLVTATVIVSGVRVLLG